MFIDFVALLLINTVGGFVLLAAYLLHGLDHPEEKGWVPGFGVVGFIALVNGLHMIWTWPLPGSYSSAYGELSVLLGGLFLGAAWAVARGWSLMPMALYAFLAGGVSVVIGFRVLDLAMTKTPLISGIGFLLSGLAGVLAAPALYWRDVRWIRVLGAAVLIGAALIWALTGYGAYWGHMEAFKNWVPATMR